MNAGQRLQRDGVLVRVGQFSAEVMPVAAHGERSGADRAAEVEGEDLAARVPPELKRHQRQQHGFSGAGRADDEGVTDIPDMQRKPERGGAFGPGVEQWSVAEMLILFRPRPDRRERDHMGEIQCADGRLADIGIGMSGQTSEPGIDRIDRLEHDVEIARLDDLLDQPQLLVGPADILVPDRDRGGDIGHAGHIRAEFLQGHVRVSRLVRGIGIDQHGLLVGHHLFEDRGDALAFGKPLTAYSGQQLGCIQLVHEDGTGRPAIGKGQPVQLVEQARRRDAGKAGDRQDAEVMITQTRLQPAGQRLVGQERIEIDRHLGHAHAMTVGRNRRMQVGQRSGVIEPVAVRHEAVEQRQHVIGTVDEAAHLFPGVHTRGFAALVEPGF